MLRLTPILLALLYGYAMFRFSAWRMKQQLDAQSSELADPKLQGVLRALARALDVPRVRVLIHEVPTVNALAAHDGRVFITRGMYDKFRLGEITAEELASVIAHEIGHVALGHSKRRMIDFSGQNALRTGLAMVLSRFIPVIGPWIAGQVIHLLTAKLSRADEFEADAYASALMLKAGLGIAPQKEMFRKLDKMTGNRGAAIPAWFLSHPKSQERIAAIVANEAKWVGGNA